MKLAIFFAALSLGIAMCACTLVEEPPFCPTDLAPTVSVPPQLPARLHNEFSGTAKVAFVVSAEGKVQSPKVLSAQWHPIGSSSGQPFGYHEAILSAVAKWRYPSRREACRHEVPVAILFN